MIQEDINYSRKDCIMLILALESGLHVPEVIFEVAESLKNNPHELRERFAISSEVEEAGANFIGFETPEDCIFWFGNGAYFSPTTGINPVPEDMRSSEGNGHRHRA